MLEKINYYNELFDIYKSLLTKKQIEYFLMYYQKDYSLMEIASYYNISRNAVYDQLTKTIKKLIELEEKLNLVEKEKERKKHFELYLKTKEIEHLKKIIEMDEDDGI